MPRTPQPLDERRMERLMRAARSAFVTSGFERASITGIMLEADFPRSSFYHYFGDKELLFESALEHGFSSITASVVPVDPRALTAETYWPSMRTMVSSIVATAEAKRLTEVATMLTLRDAPDVPSLTGFRRSARDWGLAMIRAGRRLEVVKTSAPEALQVELGWATVGAFHRWFLSDPVRRRVDADDITTALASALATPTILSGDALAPTLASATPGG